MSGRHDGGPVRPWPVRVAHITRRYWDALPETERQRIADSIPEGHVIYIAPGYRAKPGTADVSLRRVVVGETGHPSWETVRSVRGRDLAGLCWSVLAGVAG